MTKLTKTLSKSIQPTVGISHVEKYIQARLLIRRLVFNSHKSDKLAFIRPKIIMTCRVIKNTKVISTQLLSAM